MSIASGFGFPPSDNFFASAKSFGARGGFANGMNLGITGNVYYVAGNSNYNYGYKGSDGNSGRSPFSPLLTMARAFELIEDAGPFVANPIIVAWGLIREQLTAPLVKNVTIYGAGGGNPYQGTDGGVYNGAGGLTWLAPTSPTASTPLLTIAAQGWKIYNVMFGTVASTPSLRLKGLETAAFPDASHAVVQGCYFATQGGLTESGIGGWNL